MPALVDYRKKGIEELTFYVYDNLRGRAMGAKRDLIYRYDTVNEAIEKFKELPKEWSTVIGCSIGGVHENDLVQRVNGEPVKSMDYYSSLAFRDMVDVHKAMSILESMLSIQYQLVHIHPRRTMLCPLETPGHIDSYMDNKKLYIPKERRTTNLIASANEFYIEGNGWIDVKDFLKSYQEDYISQPNTPVITRVNVNYQEVDTGYTGQCDISPMSFKNKMNIEAKELFKSYVKKEMAKEKTIKSKDEGR